MAVEACQQCGKPLVQPRTGSPVKRFCSAVCRSRFGRSRRGQPAHRVVAPPPADERAARRATLQAIYDELKADIETRGSVISGRVNPCIEALRKIGVELDRYSTVVEPEEPADPIDGALRIA